MIGDNLHPIAARVYYLAASAAQWGLFALIPYGVLVEHRVWFFSHWDHRLTIAVFVLGALFGLLMEAFGRHHLSFARQFRRRQRRAHGRCEQCGYNLRGNPDVGCPECGWGRVGTDESDSQRA